MSHGEPRFSVIAANYSKKKQNDPQTGLDKPTGRKERLKMMENGTNTRQRRFDAYVEMLKQAYQVDDDGLACLLGMTPEEWEDERETASDDKSPETYRKLAQIVGNPLRFLLAEDGAGEEFAERMRRRRAAMEATVNHGRDVMTVCAKGLNDMAMAAGLGEPMDNETISSLFGFSNICEMEAERFAQALEAPKTSVS